MLDTGLLAKLHYYVNMFDPFVQADEQSLIHGLDEGSISDTITFDF